MRLNWFLPFLRKKKKSETLAPPSFVMRCAMTVLPRSWFADRVTGKSGRIRKLLQRIGPSVLSSPLRRIVQTACLLLFLTLFFYVCWPYSARPAGDGQKSDGWRLVEVEQQTGLFRFEADRRPAWIERDGQVVHVTSSAGSAAYVGAFAIADMAPSGVSLCPISELSPEAFDQLLLAQGTWSLTETEPDRWPSHYADELRKKEFVPAELFLVIDPLVSLSTAIASRSWVWSLTSAAIILVVCVLIPRGFCGYLCPLGTLIDLFDWSVARRVKRFRVTDDGWWVHIKYYLLAGTLVAAMCGVLVSGYVAAIPVVTRGLLFLGDPLQSGLSRGWHLVPEMNLGHAFSMALFAIVLCLGFLQPRFWCKYVCPSGAVFSLGNLFRITERKVESTCINCNKCVEICPFDAIKPDFTTRTSDCTLCQTCGGVCPTQAIKFVERWNLVELKVENDPPTGETSLGRRGFLSLAAGSAAAIVGGASVAVATRSFGARLDDPTAFRPVRPPGSVPERQFLEMCIRCGECFKACPNNVLQVEGFQQGFEGLWTPLVNADWAGCESSCNACGQVCPTGAIRALPLEEKKVARMGLAIVNEKTCLPFANREACQLCVDECNAAGYEAIEFINVHTSVDDNGMPVEGSGFVAPVVLADKCVGCGLCQTRCYAINVKEKHLLTGSAIVIEAGLGKEDRLMTGSYIQLREDEMLRRKTTTHPPATDFFVPESTPDSDGEAIPESFQPAADNPFGSTN
ncbi:MAG: 4Fe-4S binding protein [Planctomycetota bacterium]|nr:4Fe-4S binding protein [Planctomycetota bacterium]